MGQRMIALVLSGGGARGFAHVGVLRVLVANQVPIDMIVGTSAGALVGGAYAAGMTPDAIEDMSRGLKWRHLTRPTISPLGIFSNAPMASFIRKHFPTDRFEALKVPFAAVACDLELGTPVVLEGPGDLGFAVRASCAVPGIFRPLLDENSGRSLVDGGVVAPVPVDLAFERADTVIAVDLISCGATFRRPARSAFSIAFRSAMLLLRTASGCHRRPPDITIAPAIAHVRPDDLSHQEELIERGEAAARASMPAIESILTSVSRAEQ